MHCFNFLINILYFIYRYCNDIEIVFGSIGWYSVYRPAVSL